MMIYKLNSQEADDVGHASRRQGITTTEFMRRAIAEACDQDKDAAGGPFHYRLMAQENPQSLPSRQFTGKTACIEEAIRHGVLLNNSERCEIHVINSDKLSIWSKLFRFGRMVQQ